MSQANKQTKDSKTKTSQLNEKYIPGKSFPDRAIEVANRSGPHTPKDMIYKGPTT